MSSSDDEGETVPFAVLNYHFVNGKDEPVSFSELPIQWSEDETLDGATANIFLHGTSHDGLQKIYKKVTAWKFDISFANPEISVYSKDKNWIKLSKPRKSFQAIIRTILITVHYLHYLKHHPKASKNVLWDRLEKVFSLYEVRPSENDLVDHISLISEAFERDETFKKSELLYEFLKEKPKKRKALNEASPAASMSAFIVDDIDDMVDGVEEDESDEEGYDSVCAFCDNGGKLLCCEGSCMRSFHPTVEDGSDSLCVSLGLTPEQVEGMPTFYCQNCQDQNHQCFSCGKLGSSNKSAGAEVFRCVKATCGRFYHPKCVAKLVHVADETAAQKLEGEISVGKSFTCPVHRCFLCKLEENPKVEDLQFAVCRRCPRSYHRKCLPWKVAFEDNEEKGIIQRAWEGLIPHRILIYCLKHSILDDIGTPERNHIKFSIADEKKKRLFSEPQSSRENVAGKKKMPASSSRVITDSARSQLKSLHSAVKVGATPKKGNMPSGSDSLRRILGTGGQKKLARGPVRNVTENVDRTSTAGENKMSLGTQLLDLYSKSNLHEEVVSENPVAERTLDITFQLDAESEKRIKDLMKASVSSITMEDILKRHKGPSTHTYFSREAFNKNITQGKVDASVEAIRSALEILDSGASLQEAQAVCEPRVLTNVVKWKEKLKVYLSPFLHGMRYTSFGRHFTKVDKLEQIADRLHWYVENGDMIVDFCCGSNDFSCILKRKLEETGKTCSYKNFDILLAKNDFNFVLKDWFEVTTEELAPGSQLIMGLNPPFGVKAALANKFIDKALEFNPKLLILIVPPETQRLDEKRPPYDLVWEDTELLSGNSFYLPGSVDENDKQMDGWNSTAPPLYLWSRQDWTNKAKLIAENHGHLCRNLNQFNSKENNVSKLTSIPAADAVPMETDELEEPESRRPRAPKDDSTESLTRGQNEGLKVSILKKYSRELSSRTNNGADPLSDRRKAPIEKKRNGVASEQQKRGMYGRTDRQTPNHAPRLDRSSSERYLPSGNRLTQDSFIPEYNRGHASDTHVDFHPDLPGSGPPYEAPGFGVMGTDISHDMARHYNYDDRAFSPGPDGIGYSPFVNEIHERRESEMRSPIQSYRRQESFPSNNSYLPVHEPGNNPFNLYSNLGSSTTGTALYNRLHTSAMDRYTPRLDELNPPRVNTQGIDPHPHRNNTYNPSAVPQPQQRPPSGPSGFAFGPPQAFLNPSSSGGWIT